MQHRTVDKGRETKERGTKRHFRRETRETEKGSWQTCVKRDTCEEHTCVQRDRGETLPAGERHVRDTCAERHVKRDICSSTSTKALRERQEEETCEQTKTRNEVLISMESCSCSCCSYQSTARLAHMFGRIRGARGFDRLTPSRGVFSLRPTVRRKYNFTLLNWEM